jgi:hypothetical protein
MGTIAKSKNYTNKKMRSLAAQLQATSTHRKSVTDITPRLVDNT